MTAAVGGPRLRLSGRTARPSSRCEAETSSASQLDFPGGTIVTRRRRPCHSGAAARHLGAARPGSPPATSLCPIRPGEQARSLPCHAGTK